MILAGKSSNGGLSGAPVFGAFGLLVVAVSASCSSPPSPEVATTQRGVEQYDDSGSGSPRGVDHDFDAPPEPTSGAATQDERWWEAEDACPSGSEKVGGPPPESDEVLCKTDKGKNVGRATKFFEDGTKREEGTFEDHFAHGIWTEWNSAGQKIAETPYERGKKQGLETIWYPGGVIKSQRPYVDGKRHGVVFIWDEQERKRTAVPYEHGEKHGLEARWGLDGQLARVIEWEHGVEK